MPYLLVRGATIDCTDILDEVSIKSSRPTSGGGLRRTTANIGFRTSDLNAHPFIAAIFSKEIYVGGKNYESVYFVIYSFDRSNQTQDVTKGACYGAFQIRDDLSWEESNGVMTIAMVDMLTAQEQFAGATAEPINDIFYIYNPWYQGSIFPKVYGQVPRIKTLNSFPSFNLKKLASSINGILYTAYGTGTLVGTVLVLENNVSSGSLLLQLVAIGGTVRIKFANGEVMAGTLAHDTGTSQIKFTITTRNTYYNQVGGWTDSRDGRTPAQWGPTPNYTNVDYAVNSTIIPDAKNTILDPNGWLQADIHFYDLGGVNGDRLQTNIAVKMNGLLSERKDSVLHDAWPDPAFGGTVTDTTLSAKYIGNVSNAIYLSPAQTPLWGLTSFEFMNFFTTPQNVRLFFIDPVTAVVAGSVGDPWNLVGVTPAAVQYSCFLRNGFSKFDSDHVFCEGEGRLIKIPTANVASITQSGTYFGLAGLAKITLTDSPLNLNIGATSNIVYVDALYKTVNVNDAWLVSILREIIAQECAGGLSALMAPTLSDRTQYNSENIWPYVGVYVTSNEKVTDIIDKLCYQTGTAMRWDIGLFDLTVVAFYFANYTLVTATGPTRKYIKPKLNYTDESEMIEKSAALNIGRLKTVIDSNNLEHIQLHFKATYGGWQDPYYNAVKSEINRTIKPRARYIEYHSDYINDPNSFRLSVAMMMSIGHASGYASIQRKISTEMTMNGCRWEALDGIIFKDYPVLSIGNTNAIIDTDGKIMYEKPIVIVSSVDIVSPFFIMGAVACVDEVDYIFNVLNPIVKLTARMSQLNVDDVTGITYYSAPGVPDLPGPPSTTPGTPPNKGSGSHSSGTGSGGNSLLMPEIHTQPADIIIDSASAFNRTFNLTVDSGWLFDLGWDFYAEVVDPKGTDGAALVSGASGSFPNKTSDAYVPPTFYLVLRVYYFWFEAESLGTTSREIKIKITRTYHITKDPASDTETDFFYLTIPCSRVPPIGIDPS